MTLKKRLPAWLEAVMIAFVLSWLAFSIWCLCKMIQLQEQLARIHL